MRILVAVILASMLPACSNQVGFGTGGSSGLAYNNGGDGYGNAAGGALRPSLTNCVYAGTSVSNGIPTLATGVLQKASRGSGRVQIALEDVLNYASLVVGASGGDGIAAAEMISNHEAADSACFRKQLAYWKGQGSSGEAAKNVTMLSQANTALGQAYSTLKTYTASGDSRDLSERLSRSYIPVGMQLPRAVL